MPEKCTWVLPCRTMFPRFELKLRARELGTISPKTMPDLDSNAWRSTNDDSFGDDSTRRPQSCYNASLSGASSQEAPGPRRGHQARQLRLRLRDQPAPRARAACSVGPWCEAAPQNIGRLSSPAPHTKPAGPSRGHIPTSRPLPRSRAALPPADHTHANAVPSLCQPLQLEGDHARPRRQLREQWRWRGAQPARRSRECAQGVA